MYIILKNGSAVSSEGTIDNFPTKSKFCKVIGTEDKVPFLLNTDDISMVINDEDAKKLVKEKK